MSGTQPLQGIGRDTPCNIQNLLAMHTRGNLLLKVAGFKDFPQIAPLLPLLEREHWSRWTRQGISSVCWFGFFSGFRSDCYGRTAQKVTLPKFSSNFSRFIVKPTLFKTVI